MAKKILMVAGPYHSNPPLKGAAVETWMYEVSKRIVGLEPHIVSIGHPFYPLKEYKDGIFFHRIHFSALYKRVFNKILGCDPFSYPQRVARIIDAVQPDIVHMHNTIRWFIPLAKNMRKKEGIKTILHMQNESSTSAPVMVDAFVGCSNYIVNSYKTTAVNAGSYLCISNGVDIDRFKPHWEVSLLKQAAKKQFGIDSKNFVVLFAGRVSSEKGVEHFIKSALMLKDRKNITFLVVGEIRKENRKNDRVQYANDMISMAAPLKERILFTDVFPHSKIHHLYLLSDLLVLPSNFEEPFSMVAIEAMATGLPVIARKRGGLKEYIRDGENGLFIDDRSPAEDIAKKITLLITDSALRERMAKNGRKTVEDNFSWEKIASDTERLYSRLLL